MRFCDAVISSVVILFLFLQRYSFCSYTIDGVDLPGQINYVFGASSRPGHFS